MKKVNIVITAAIAFCMISTCVFAGLHEPPAPPEPEEDETLGIIGLIVGCLIMSYALGFIAGYTVGSHDSKDNGADTEALRKIDRDNDAQLITSNLNFLQSLMSERTKTGANSIKYLTTYAQRQAEVVVSSVWEPGATFDADDILSMSRIYERLSAEAAISTWYMSKTFDPYSQLTAGWNATPNDIATYGAGKMQVGFVWQQANTIQSASSPIVQYGFGTTVTSTSNNKVYIDTLDYGDYSSFLYVDGGSALIQSAADPTKTYGLLPGYNDLSWLEPGIYNLQPGRSYVGSIFPVVHKESADVTAAAALITGSDIAYAFLAGAGVSILHTGSKVNSNLLTYTISYDGKTRTVDLIPALAAINAVMTECIQVAVRAAIAAQAQWSLFNLAGESLQFISPSSILPVLQSLEVSADELTLITAAALMQISDYVQRNQKAITEADIMLSSADQQLIVIGDIRDNFGNTIVSGARYTPYNWINDIKLKRGTTLSWDQPGIAAVWNDSGPPDLITLQPGYVLVITDIKSKGATVNEYSLEVIPLPKMVNPKWEPHPSPTPTPELTSIASVVQILVVMLGLAIAIAHVAPKSPIVVIIGLIIAAVGYFAAGLITSLVWGAPPWWWPW